MWKNFFPAGGFGMYPTLIFGFVLIALAILSLVRGADGYHRQVRWFAALTVASGVLGTVTGLASTVHYAKTVPAADELMTLAMGTEESLHNLVLAMILFVLGGLLAAIATMRSARARAGANVGS